MSDAPPRRGRTTVSARAMERIVTAVTAEEFEVGRRDVSPTLTDDRGALDLEVTTAIRVVSIGRFQGDETALARSGGSIVDRARRGEETISRRVAELTGATVGRIRLRFTSARIRQERRVR